MRSLERKFRHLENTNSSWSSYTCFAVTVAGKRLSRKTVGHWFHVLVEKEDYDKREERAILNSLMDLTKRAEDGSKWTEICHQRT